MGVKREQQGEKEKNIYITEMGIKRNSGELSRRQGATSVHLKESREKGVSVSEGRGEEWRVMDNGW